jgi:hypothetical protein
MDKVITYGMAPAHVPPNIAVRVVLVEQMIFTSIEHRAIGIVHEMGRRSEVILRPQGLVIVGLLGRCKRAE